MIYTVTFNPSLDYIVSVENFQLGLTNRTSSEMLLPGGKGINVSTVLMNLGIESTALGFTAGFTGDEIIRRLEEMVQQGSSRFTIPFNRQELADYLGVDRSALSNELGKMRKEGIIEVNRNQIHYLECV